MKPFLLVLISLCAMWICVRQTSEAPARQAAEVGITYDRSKDRP
jgi:hypothetical protein